MKAESLVGRWRITRRIDDRLAGQVGRFDGEAVFTPGDAGMLTYAEAGSLRLGDGPPMPATRVYLWRIEADRVTVMFGDGRPFHAFDPAGAAMADHWCDPDTYRVAYDFSDFPRWRAVWTVVGPRKDYVMDSAFARP